MSDYKNILGIILEVVLDDIEIWNIVVLLWLVTKREVYHKLNKTIGPGTNLTFSKKTFYLRKMLLIKCKSTYYSLWVVNVPKSCSSLAANILEM